MENIKTIFDRIHNFIYANEGYSRQQAFDEFIKILFIGFVDRNIRLGHFFITDNEYRMLNLGKNSTSFSKRINDLYKETKRIYPDVFEKDSEIKLKLLTLGYSVRLLSRVKFEKIMTQMPGAAFQGYVNEKQRSERGQFFTPHSVVSICVEKIKPKAGERILDPACGSGSFLIEAKKYLGEMSKGNIFGIEINPTIARIAKMGAILSQFDPSSIIVADSLNKQKTKKFDGFADVVFTNPPFGKQAKISNKAVLSEYELYNGKAKSVVPEILFVERSIEMAREGGVVVIILPNGNLENKSLGYVRDYIKEKTKITDVIDLPKSTFQPFGTTVKTSVIILRKRSRVSQSYRIEFKKYIDGVGIIEKYDLAVKRAVLDRFDYEHNKNTTRKNKKVTYKKISEISTIVSEKVDTSKLSGQIKYISISDIDAKRFQIENSRKYLSSSLPKRASYCIKQEDLLVSLAGEYLGSKRQAVAVVDKNHSGAIVSSGFCVLRKIKIDPLYLLYFLKSEDYLSQIKALKKGSLIPSVSLNDFKKIEVPILPEKQIKLISKRVRYYLEAVDNEKKIRESIFGNF